MPKVALVSIAYNLVGGVVRQYKSAVSNCDLTYVIYNHSYLSKVHYDCCLLSALPNVVLHDFRVNRGLPKTWNEALLSLYPEYDVVILTNEDILFGPHDIDKIAEMAMANRQAWAVFCRAAHKTMYDNDSVRFSCLAINPIALETVGCFDQNFFPAYFEDADYLRRVKLAKIDEVFCKDTQLTHIGSASLLESRAKAQNELTSALNRNYYTWKWGADCDSGAELYEHPFNDQRFSYRINPKDRENPYPGYDRVDQGIVVI